MVVVEDDVGGRFCGLLDEALFENFLLLDGGVGVLGGALGGVGEVRRLEVFCEDAAAVGGEDEDRVDLRFAGG